MQPAAAAAAAALARSSLQWLHGGASHRPQLAALSHPVFLPSSLLHSLLLRALPEWQQRRRRSPWPKRSTRPPMLTSHWRSSRPTRRGGQRRCDGVWQTDAECCCAVCSRRHNELLLLLLLRLSFRPLRRRLSRPITAVHASRAAAARQPIIATTAESR